MTVCDQCKQLFDGINDICADCERENEINLDELCGYCGGDHDESTCDYEFGL